MTEPFFKTGQTYKNRKGVYTVLDFLDGKLLVKYVNGGVEQIKDLTRQQRIVEELLEAENRQTDSTITKGKKSPHQLTDNTFKQEEVRPVVAEIIKKIYQQTQTFVSHRQIVKAFLVHPEGREIVIRTQINRQNAHMVSRTDEYVVSNMVAWFSKLFTDGSNPYLHIFEREQIKGVWAYKPVQR